MVDVSKSSAGYAYVAPPGINPNQKALNEAADAAGRERPKPTQSLALQARDMTNFGGNLIDMIQPNGVTERSRGIDNIDTLSLGMVEAYQRAAKRMNLSAAAANARVASGPAIASSIGNGGIASAIASLGRGINSSPILNLLGNIQSSRSAATAVNLLKIQGGYNANPGGDPFARKIVTTYGSGGAVGLQVERVGLRTESLEIPTGADSEEPVSAIQLVRDGGPTASNEGFLIRSAGSKREDTIVIDTRDPAQEDGRLSSVDVDAGEGSDVIHISGNTYSVIKAGDGNDLVTAEGESVIFGGAGDDLLNGKTISGDVGHDVVYATSFGSGGEGNDLVTLFGLTEPEEGIDPVASGLGGAGNDTILADVSAAIDGGAGEDVMVLRRGGLALGGTGNDTISALTDAQVDGGAGNDDILLLQGGLALGGEGNDQITVSGYGEAAGGKGNDNVNLYSGGIYRYEAGDGADRLLISTPDTEAAPRASQVNLEGFLYSDVTISASKGFVSITSKTTSDKIEITLVDAKLPLELRFAKGTDAQFVTVEGTKVKAGIVAPRDRVI
ncbi:MAG: hypothetical protein ACRC56_12255 [Bosea sp. (in: a-proteobacteria)]